MPEPALRKTLLDSAENLEKLSSIFQDIGVAIAEHYPGLSLVIGDYTDSIKQEAVFLREY